MNDFHTAAFVLDLGGFIALVSAIFVSVHWVFEIAQKRARLASSLVRMAIVAALFFTGVNARNAAAVIWGAGNVHQMDLEGSHAL